MNEKREHIQFDQYQRYMTVSRVIDYWREKKGTTSYRILELGSNEHKDLEAFLPDDEILYTDLVLTESMKSDPAFMQADGSDLPFEDGSFDFVVALDVLEHVPAERRRLFFSEASRVAGKAAILAFPYQASYVQDAEYRVNDFYKSITGDDFIWLKEHRENGLPDLNRVEAVLSDLRLNSVHFFHGDIHIWEEMWCSLFRGEVEYGRLLNRFYNQNLYRQDVSDHCYRVFYVLSRTDLAGVERYVSTFWESKNEETYDLLSVLLKKHSKTGQGQSAIYAANLYFDTGEGYNQENSVSVAYDAALYVDFTASIPDETAVVRLDMVEGYFCVIKNLEILSDRGVLSYRNVNGLSFERLEVFCTTDPQIEICLSPGVTWLRVRADVFVISDARLISKMQSVVLTEKQKFDGLHGVLVQTETERDGLRDSLVQAETERDGLRDSLVQTEAERDGLRDSLVQTEAERDGLRDSLTQAEAERDSLRNQLQQMTAKAEELNAQLLNVSNSFEIISNSACWKITKPVRVVLDRVKTIRFLNLSIKGLKSLKANGLSFTWRKIQRWRDSNNYMETTNDEDSNKNIMLYESDYQANQDYSSYTTDIKMLAFYLPQYHTFPENDAWWGKGFTEWTNVKKSVPRFEGHYQPRVPHADIGYYCLEDVEVMRKQAVLAKQHGIYGFCFYYYWFSGKRLMEKPVDQLLEHPEIEIPFCLCWANENWTRRWDGQEQDVLIGQKYTDRDDRRFIVDLKKYLDDSRYIRIDGKPVIIVYNPTAIPNCRKSFTMWRETARELGIGEIKIWICLTWGRDAKMLKISDIVDAEVEFPPHSVGGDWMEIKGVEREGKDCIIYDYRLGADYIMSTWKTEKQSLLPKYPTCMLAWDNAPRRKDGWHAFYHFRLIDFYRWVSEAVIQSRKSFPPEERFVFINAWNEWGEGTYLEPEEKYGYANINTLSKAIFDLPFDWNTTVITDDFPIGKLDEGNDSDTPQIAVQAHVFFLDLVDEMIEFFNHIPYRFDLYITTDQEEKKHELLRKFESSCHCESIQVLVLENRGRDVAPLLMQISSVLNRYEYIGHFHSKKTVTAEYGEDWRKYLFQNLLGSKEYVERVFGLFEKKEDLGVVFPELYPPIREHAKWNGENEGIHALLTRMDCDCELPDQLMFPAGNMFWARAEAVKPLIELGLTQADFPEECGQRYATVAHQIERSWAYIAQSKGYSAVYVMNGCGDK